MSSNFPVVCIILHKLWIWIRYWQCQGRYPFQYVRQVRYIFAGWFVSVIPWKAVNEFSLFFGVVACRTRNGWLDLVGNLDSSSGMFHFSAMGYHQFLTAEFWPQGPDHLLVWVASRKPFWSALFEVSTPLSAFKLSCKTGRTVMSTYLVVFGTPNKRKWTLTHTQTTTSFSKSQLNL